MAPHAQSRKNPWPRRPALDLRGIQVRARGNLWEEFPAGREFRRQIENIQPLIRELVDDGHDDGGRIAQLLYGELS